MLREYYALAKPGIVYGNLLTALAGFLYASAWRFSLATLLALLIGLALVVASACVFNNYLDRGIDAKMARTKSRPLVSGAISPTAALIYGAILGLVGFAFLYFGANVLSAFLAALGWLLYVCLYTPAKHATPYATIIGALPGAVPIVVGYAAAAGALALPAYLLYFALALWQMPHFYAIALYRKEEYAAAGVPTMATRVAAPHLKAAIAAYILLFAWTAALLVIGGFAGYAYLALVLALGLSWLFVALKSWRLDDARWGRRVFLASLVVLLGYAAAVSTALLLP